MALTPLKIQMKKNMYFLREARTSRGFGVWFIISIVMKYICGVLHLIKLPQLNNETMESK